MLNVAIRIDEAPGRRLVEVAAADIQRRGGGSGGAGRQEGRSRTCRGGRGGEKGEICRGGGGGVGRA
jgi:hypothetical protein